MVQERYPGIVIYHKGLKIANFSNVSLKIDLDTIYNQASFTISKVSMPNEDIEKFDTIEIYFGYFTSQDSVSSSLDTPYTVNVSPDALNTPYVKIFNGYVHKVSLNQSKDSGQQYKVECRSNLGLTFEYSMKQGNTNAPIDDLFRQGLQLTGIRNKFNKIYINGIGEQFASSKVDTSTQYFGEVLESLKDKYAFVLYEDGESNIYLSTPFYFSQQTVSAYVYDLQENTYDIDYNTVTNNIDTVIVVGNGNIGIAFDPIAYQLKRGTELANVDINEKPNPEEINPRILYRRDISGSEELREVARNKLVELAKNYTISLSAQYIPGQIVGEQFIVRNANLPETQIWTIKTLDITISKDSIQSSITGFSNSAARFPEDVLLSSSGLLSISNLEVLKKATSQLDIRS